MQYLPFGIVHEGAPGGELGVDGMTAGHQAPVRTTWRRSLPVCVRGRDATTRTVRGALNAASRFRASAIRSADRARSSTVRPPATGAVGTTKACSRVAPRLSGTAATATSRTDGW